MKAYHTGAYVLCLLQTPGLRYKIYVNHTHAYVELYGFIDEAREYYIRNADGEGPVSKQKH